MKRHYLSLNVITKITQALAPLLHQAVDTSFVKRVCLSLKPVSNCDHDFDVQMKTSPLQCLFLARYESHTVKGEGCMVNVPTHSTEPNLCQLAEYASGCMWALIVVNHSRRQHEGRLGFELHDTFITF
ncbi:hypothetical protein CEXT_456511 [Caerostris extrusa]|uniref:Uncharacterized protein n=1 Tax=Caerostris extrusa TaxID=172846 RepID=A0AAV4XZA8_CAEEX|nr:hypothetical protein CEXT_456511 [Caerostris extrusa]